MRLFGRIVAREGKGRFDHALHVVEVGQHLVALLLVLDELGAQPQAGDRRAQVVRDGRQHLRAVLDEAANALLHLVEGARGPAHLHRSRLAQRWRIDVHAQALRGSGEDAKRLVEVMDDDHREDQHGAQHDRHGQHEAVGEHRVGMLDRGGKV